MIYSGNYWTNTWICRWLASVIPFKLSAEASLQCWRSTALSCTSWTGAEGVNISVILESFGMLQRSHRLSFGGLSFKTETAGITYFDQISFDCKPNCSEHQWLHAVQIDDKKFHHLLRRKCRKISYSWKNILWRMKCSCVDFSKGDLLTGRSEFYASVILKMQWSRR